MAVKHSPTGIVHKGTKGGTTGCGTDTKLHPSKVGWAEERSPTIKTIPKIET